MSCARSRPQGKISDRTKQNLHSEEIIQCSIRNANWVMQYWTCEPHPDPIQAEYGYSLHQRVPEYAD